MRRRFDGRKAFRRSLIATAVAAALAGPTIGWAQTADATLTGRVAPDSEVTARNVATGATRRTKASAQGTYTLVGLPPGTYRVDAGPGTETAVTLTVASTATLDLAAGGATVGAGESIAEVTVHAKRLVEVKTSEVGTTISQQQIETVPQLTRNFLEFADTVPGLVFSTDHNGRTSLRGGAQNDDSVNVYIDGVGQKGYVRSGLSGQTDNTQGNPFPQLAIGEYKVISSNYKAEFDQVSSAAVTAGTRSGTNEFHGEAFGTYTSDHFRAETAGELATNPNVKTPSKDKEFGVALGGPIIPDVLHFFVTYEGKRFDTPVTVVAGGNAPPNIIAQLPPAALAQLGPASLTFNEDLAFGKLDWEPTGVDRFVLAAKIRSETGLGNIGDQTAVSAGLETKNTDNRVDLRWERSADRWFNEALVTWEDAFFTPKVKGGSQNGADYTWQNAPGSDSLILQTNGSDPRAGQNKGQKGWAIADDITFSHLTWWAGDHTVKTGIKFKYVKLTAQDSIANAPVFTYDVSATGTAAIPYKVVFGSPVPGFPPLVTSQDKQLGLYLQDDWATNDKLTLNLGVRWDIEWNPSYLDFQTPQIVLNGLNGPTNPPGTLTYGQSLGAGTDPNRLNINDYISNGHNRSAYTGEFQPRLGFSYDLNADQRHVIFGGAGRSYDRDLYDFLQLEQNKFALGQAQFSFNVPDHPCTVGGFGVAGPCIAFDPKFLNGVQNLQALAAGNPSEADLMNNRLKVPYSDQFSLGIRNRVGDWNTSAALARIISKDGFVFTLGNRFPNGAFWMNGGQPWGNGIPGIGALIIGSNGIETRNTQLLLSAEKPFTPESHWGATIAYTYTDATQNRDITQHYSFDEVTIRQYPFIASNAAAKHRLVISGSVGLPWDFIVAGKLTLATPIPTNQISCYNDATVFPTGGHCTAVAFTAPGLGYRSLDLEATKNFNIKDVSSVYVRLDVLNVFNTKNFVDYNTTAGANGLLTSGQYNPNGNITGSPRELRMTVGAKF
jgi:outer membrane receptor protein involved in Fe transport